ncbi:MAG: Mrp/NBP35 family ATP-binding protein [Alphaproteobacteria bacterium]|nr:Mrp/NBP35 family ATP-binding protein [Alphaproteobacteria bacterium]
MSYTELAQAVRRALGSVQVPGGGDLASFAGLSDIIVTPKAVAFAISVAPGMERAFAQVREGAEKAAATAAGERRVLVSLTADRRPAPAGPAPNVPPGAGGPATRARQPINNQTPVAGIKKIIAVASGKGGVGKSTCAVNLALALAELGKSVGILDADVYGPSMPKLLSLEGKPMVREDGNFTPHEAFGLKVMSIGSMLEGDQAVVWRGPMATAALRQLLRETVWGELDVLVVDLPPGTGDVHISLCQTVPLAGAVIVSTPQDLALIDARKAVDMFRRLKIPILGVIENMSYFVAPDTGNRYDIFGHGGAQQAAKDLSVPFLGEIPLDISIREQSDAGTPAISLKTGSAGAFTAVAAALIEANPALSGS